MTDWNLSDKIIMGLEKENDMLNTNSVKEFIRRLKEDIEELEITKQIGKSSKDWFNIKIDTLAGDKLVEKEVEDE